MKKKVIFVWLGRIFVAGVFLFYGGLKLSGGQFIPGDFTFDTTVDNPITLVWHFFGYSPVYHRFVALMEIVPAILILIPRTATLGALLVSGVALNVLVMDLSFGFPVPATTVIALVFCVSVALLWAGRRKLSLLCSREETEDGGDYGDR